MINCIYNDVYKKDPVLQEEQLEIWFTPFIKQARFILVSGHSKVWSF